MTARAERLAAAREALKQAQAYVPHNDLDARARDNNIEQLEAYINRLATHPAGGA